MTPLSHRVGEIMVTALVFGAVFAAGAAASCVAYSAWLGPGTVDELVFGFITIMFAIYAAAVAAAAGAVAGALYALTPRRARDVWMAMAIGAGVVLTGLTFTIYGRSPPPYIIAPVVLAAFLSALCARITRNFGTYE